MIMKQFMDEAARNKVQEKILPFNRFWIKNCTVTPLNVYFNGPMMEEGNRVVRKFSYHVHQFMRVNFEDEDGKRIATIGSSSIEKLAQEFICGGSCIELPVSGNFMFLCLPDSYFSSFVHFFVSWLLVLSGFRIGLIIIGMKFDLFGYSNSQVRESKAWYFSESEELSKATINEFIGDLSTITNVSFAAFLLLVSWS